MGPDKEIERALAIVGPEDFGTDGEQGHLVIGGAFADAIVDSLNLVPSFTSQFRGKPVRLSRGGTLEIWINGWYTEGRGVRRIVHSAARLITQGGNREHHAD